MLKFKTLKFKNIGRFTAEQFIDFTRLNGLIQVDAINNSTGGGSSGSGKSTIFNSLDWLLGLSDLSTSVLQSRLTKETISVEGAFDWNGREVIVRRSKKLSVTIDGVEVTGSAKLAEEELDKIISMPRHLFRQMLHRRQGESGFFLGMTPSQMNSFLTDCLGLETIRTKTDLIDQKLKNLTTLKTQVQTDLRASQAALEATISAKTSLGQEPTTNVTEALVEGWKLQLEQSQGILKDIQDKHSKEKADLDQKKPKLVNVPYDTANFNALEAIHKELSTAINLVNSAEKDRQSKINNKISALKLEAANQVSSIKIEHGKAVSELNNKIKDLNFLIQSGVDAKNNAIKIGNQLKELRSGTCYTCQQAWVTQTAKDQEQILLQELSKHKLALEKSAQASVEVTVFKEQLDTLMKDHNERLSVVAEESKSQLALLAEEAKPQIPTELENLNAKLSEVSSKKTEERQKENKHNNDQNAANNRLMASFFEEQKVLTDRHKEEIKNAMVGIENARSQYDQCRLTLKSHEESLARHKSSTDSLNTKETELNQKVVEMDQKAVQASQDLEIAEEVKRCLKSYLSCSFDDALDSVSESATEILRAVPTMSNATIRLEGTKELSSGIIKETVNAVLDNDGEIDIPIKSLSGGERSAVDLAVDLAVCQLIQEKTNRGVDLICLDEVFGGFDSVGIEQALEMLKTLDKRILIVEHNNVAKEFVSDKITVVREGETSYIRN